MKRILSAVVALSATFALTTLVAPPAQAQTALFEPGTSWSVLHTPHFRIYYTPPLAAKAKEVANIAEEAHKLLVPFMKVTPGGPTEVIISDVFDELNSLAHNSPHRAVWLWMTPPNPDEGMPIGRYDQWLRLLFIHEYTHILQFEHTPWLANQVNSALGGFIFSRFPQLPIDITLQLPDLLTNAPSYFTEGLAVYTESTLTPGGRGVEGEFEMQRRMAFLEDRTPTYDQIYGRYLLDWPMAGYEYIWGTGFIQHLVKKHGPEAPAKILQQYGLFPYLGFDNAVWRATGDTAQSLFEENKKALATQYAAEAEAHKTRVASRTGATAMAVPKDVTTTGRYHRHPLWLADGTLLYGEAMKNQSARLWADKLDGSPRTVVMGKSTRSAASVGKDQDKIYYETDTSESPRGLTSYRDIYYYDRKTKTRNRVTKQARVFAPQVSPDGELLVAVPNGDAKTGLVIFDKDGKRLREWRFDQNAYQFGNPMWSPDGKKIAVAVWHAGMRDLWLADPVTGEMEPLWRDEGVDIYPSWSPDGKQLVFTSDRTNKVFNLHVFDLETRQMRQLTDVIGGAFDPAVSPDGKAIAFANYTGRGYDIQTIPLTPSATPRLASLGLPKPQDRGTPKVLPEAEIAGITSYNPIGTMLPSVWFPLFSEDEKGQNVTVYTYWQDLLRQHSLVLINGYGFGSGRLNYGLSYGNSQGPVPWSIFMIEYPGAGRQPLFPDPNNASDVVWANRWQWTKSAAVSFQWPGLRYPLFDPPPITGDNWTGGLRTERVEDYMLQVDADAIPAQHVDKFPAAARMSPISPGELPQTWTAQDSGLYHSAYVQYQRAEALRWPYDYGPTEGQLSTFGLEGGLSQRVLPTNGINPATGNATAVSNGPFARLWADHRWYTPVPFGTKHSMAFRTTAGAVYGRNGDYYLAASRAPFGYQPLSTINRWDLTSATDYSNRQILMRGHSFALGNRVLTAGAEYRFPIMEVTRGWGEFPLFINQLYGVAFFDAGALWGLDSTKLEAPTVDDLLTGTGAELRARTSMFQSVPIDLRLGVAQGVTRGPALGGDFQVNWGLGTTF